MNILIVSAPAIESYTNLCYRFVEIGETAGYLQNQQHSVLILDSLMMDPKIWLRELESKIIDTDMLIFYHSGDTVSSAIHYARHAKRIKPEIKCITYGIVST